MSRHEHSTKLYKLIKELREHEDNRRGGPGYGHRGINLIIADALSALDDEIAAVDAASRDSLQPTT